ncbi:phosphoribosylaminoimidazolesuccinocarboxamide synthase [Cupriavidus consociatus]|uniref:phosphoribosylaminoimidazolesuccinocarboxamide synthase n=1 Tax=Cupriavidus consociatus TaxID=2821357 RepID=UPI001AE76315|nr:MULTISPECIES: phosphoribosylaminoimidazolesuccinocarboxamide synthase [unclassified Cupriavidus]MBP0625244.1 hypothetical protein [Cupriavidus sp. LEh25]MDK2661979.1 phosphoribosylaminoimidazolesuccinocarboxamide synthase [Cupriavidus sp. LEh21]
MTPDRLAVCVLQDQCEELDLRLTLTGVGDGLIFLSGPAGESIRVRLFDPEFSMLEQVIRGLRFEFDNLPLLCRGESKEIRLLTRGVAVAKLLPTVYSFTENRYGQVEGTEIVRSCFSAMIFREMKLHPGARHIATAFIGSVQSPFGNLLVERVVDPGNIEVRVKRYHIGSPVHRYKYTERHGTRLGGEPLKRWNRFESPVVCFDWRNPIFSDENERLADEPLPDDYASIWIDDIHNAKRLARQAFEWIEEKFQSRGLQLIDICFFIDRTGTVIFGEISPDCMRVRKVASDSSEALDKDQWRSGGDPPSILARYRKLTDILFD